MVRQTSSPPSFPSSPPQPTSPSQPPCSSQKRSPPSAPFLLYGKTLSSSSSSLSTSSASSRPPTTITTLARTIYPRLTTWTLPKQTFTHFYLLALAESLALPFLLHHPLSPPQSSLLALFTLHAARRLLESAVAFPSSSRARIHAAHYVAGIAFYAVTPPALVAATDPSPAPVTRAVAAAVAGAAMAVQCVAHWGLAGLRKKKKTAGKDGKDEGAGMDEGYVHPAARVGGAAGPWFRLVACPHYFAELVLYVAFAVFARGAGGAGGGGSGSGSGSGGGLSAAAVAVAPWAAVLWVAVDLGVSADETWRWYRRRFGDAAAPRGWKRMVPFVY
ncbi:hypothetical protein DFJ73DRAFT_792541 [Zopfochytrium polystomum]|nr:hypothetical protein DFJ73DRAFT_792541 [Zopfochytrium polystomum]